MRTYLGGNNMTEDNFKVLFANASYYKSDDGSVEYVYK